MSTEDTLAFARRLGRHCAAYVAEPAVLEAIHAAITAGSRPSDAVLAAVKRRALDDRAVEDEFAAYILPLAMDAARTSLRTESWLRSHLETSDLAASVFGQLWPRLSEVEFETEAEFCSLLARRMERRLVDHARRFTAEKRSEDRRVDHRPEDLTTQPAAPGPGPLENAMGVERDSSFRAALARLPDRQRHVLELFVYEHMDRNAIAQTLGIRYEAVRIALQRAVERVQRMLDADG